MTGIECCRKKQKRPRNPEISGLFLTIPNNAEMSEIALLAEAGLFLPHYLPENINIFTILTTHLTTLSRFGPLPA